MPLSPRSLATTALMALRGPPQLVLTRALRRLGRARPEVFERLGEARRLDILVAPEDFPVAFRLRPDGTTGTVTVVRPDDPAPVAARISGPLLTLLSLFDGRFDADSAFFSRAIRITGDTAAVVALHNTLEAAELTLADLIGLPPALRDRANGWLAAGMAVLQRRAA